MKTMKPKIKEADLPTIALVGRVNVGKSTLFNRIVEKEKALVSKIAGTTRTRNIGVAWWRGTPIRVIDTGGMTSEKKVDFIKDIEYQIKLAMSQADLIVFMVDIKEKSKEDLKNFTKVVKKIKKPILLVANKADNNRLAQKALHGSWKALGLGKPIPVSASTGRGAGDLLDEIYTKLDITDVKYKEEEKAIRVAIIGKPNVGKSSLFNTLIGQDRVIVSEIPHTTREAHDTRVEWNNQDFVFVDTAGIRRKGKMKGGLEQKGVGQALRQIQSADIVLFVLDSNEKISHQDKALAGLIEDERTPIIIVANKWDVTKTKITDMPHIRRSHAPLAAPDPQGDYEKYLASFFKFVDFAPIIFVSAKTGWHVTNLLPLILEVDHERRKNIDPVKLDEAFKKMVAKHMPVKGKGVRHPKIFSIKQVDSAPPVFELRVKTKTHLHETYIRYLERQIRRVFGFKGVPLVLYIKKGG